MALLVICRFFLIFSFTLHFPHFAFIHVGIEKCDILAGLHILIRLRLVTVSTRKPPGLSPLSFSAAAAAAAATTMSYPSASPVRYSLSSFATQPSSSSTSSSFSSSSSLASSTQQSQADVSGLQPLRVPVEGSAFARPQHYSAQAVVDNMLNEGTTRGTGTRAGLGEVPQEDHEPSRLTHAQNSSEEDFKDPRPSTSSNISVSSTSTTASTAIHAESAHVSSSSASADDYYQAMRMDATGTEMTISPYPTGKRSAATAIDGNSSSTTKSPSTTDNMHNSSTTSITIITTAAGEGGKGSSTSSSSAPTGSMRNMFVTPMKRTGAHNASTASSSSSSHSQQYSHTSALPPSAAASTPRVIHFSRTPAATPSQQQQQQQQRQDNSTAFIDPTQHVPFLSTASASHVWITPLPLKSAIGTLEAYLRLPTVNARF